MPAALKKPTLDELCRRLRNLDYSQLSERMAMLNAILQLESQGEGREDFSLMSQVNRIGSDRSR